MAPLGLSKAATDPWLPGSDIDPLVVLAWILMLFAPVAAPVVAQRRYTASGSAPPLAGASARQVVAAGLLKAQASNRTGSWPADARVRWNLTAAQGTVRKR